MYSSENICHKKRFLNRFSVSFTISLTDIYNRKKCQAINYKYEEPIVFHPMFMLYQSLYFWEVSLATMVETPKTDTFTVYQHIYY